MIADGRKDTMSRTLFWQCVLVVVLLLQVEDRRSAVNKQACAALSVTAQVGSRPTLCFETWFSQSVPISNALCPRTPPCGYGSSPLCL